MTASTYAHDDHQPNAALRTVWVVEHYFIKLEKGVVSAALALVLLSAAAQMVVRQLGGRSIGTDELASLAMVTLVFIGSPLAVATHDHIEIDLVSYLRSTRLVRALRVGVLGFVAVFALVFTIYAVRYLEYAATSGERSLQLHIPLALGIAIMTTGAILTFLHALSAIARQLTGNHIKSPTKQATTREPEGAAK